MRALSSSSHRECAQPLRSSCAASTSHCSATSALAGPVPLRRYCATAAAGNATPSASASSSAPDAGAAAALSPLRFRSGRHRMTAIERAAAAAHEALAHARPAAPALAPQVGGLPGRPGALAAVGRSGGGAGSEGSEGEGSPAPVSLDAQEAAVAAEERRKRIVGQLQVVPHVISAAEQLASARKRAAKVTPSAGIKNEAERERSRGARRLDTLMKELSVPLSRYVAAFPSPERLHPFERALLGLTVGEGSYTAALERVDRLRRAVQEVGKGAASRASSAANKAAAVAAAEEGAEAIEQVFTAGARHVDALKEVAKKLRQLPSLDTSLPTLALVGAPNVGKSSLVNVLSSGTPEVCNYPFTTRSIKMGHFYLDSQKHQVTDTPGLLARPDAQRNRMEALTLAALGCLDSAVLFVADLTEECGTSAGDQWAVRSELRSRFPGKPWIDVLSKADMLEDLFAQADQLVRTQQAPAESSAPGAEAAAPRGAAEASEAADAGEAGTLSPVEVAARLPGALRVSSLTHDGIPELQLAIIRALRAHAAERRRREEEARAGRLAGLPQKPRPVGPVAPAGGKPPVLTLFSS